MDHLRLEIRDNVPVLTIPQARTGFGYLLRGSVTKSHLPHDLVMSIINRRDEETVEVELNPNTYAFHVRWMFREYASERDFYLKYTDTAEMLKIGDMPEVLPFMFNGEYITSEKDLPRFPDRLVPVGSFELTQPTLRITDPWYQVGTWCADTTEAVPGKYDAYVFMKFDGSWNEMHRPGLLAIFHESYIGPIDIEVFRTSPVVCNAGVDSGQCGFFDDAFYPRDEAEFQYEDDRFYGKCCNMTLDDREGGIVENFGVVSGTFVGDGGYDCHVILNGNGKVFAACLDYSWHFSVEDGGYEDDDCCDHDAETGLMFGCEREGDEDQEDAINCQNDGGF